MVDALAVEDVESYIVRLPRFGTKNKEIVQDVAERVPKEVDLIHVQHEYGLYQGFENVFFSQLRTLGKPIITTMHAVGNYEFDVMISGVNAKVIVHNEFCKSRMPYPNVTVIPHGTVMGEPLNVVEAKKAMHIDPSIKIVGYLGFISNYKGLETLVEAMLKVKNAALLICGGWHTTVDSDYMRNLKDWSLKMLKGRIIWSGFIPEEKLAATYGAMDVLVYPSRWVTESGALLHAIGYGRAVIASDLEPNREKEKEGTIQTFKDVPDLVEKINTLLNDDLLRASYQMKARKYAETYSWKNIAKTHVALYEEVLKVKQ